MSACEKMWSFVRCTMLLFAVKFWSRPPELEQNNWKISFKQLYFSECFSPPWRKQQCFGEKETFLFKIHFDFVFLYTCAAVLCYDFLTKAINWLWDGHSFIFSQTNVPLFLVLRSTLTKGHIKIIVLWVKKVMVWMSPSRPDNKLLSVSISNSYRYCSSHSIDNSLHQLWQKETSSLSFLPGLSSNILSCVVKLTSLCLLFFALTRMLHNFALK